MKNILICFVVVGFVFSCGSNKPKDAPATVNEAEPAAMTLDATVVPSAPVVEEMKVEDVMSEMSLDATPVMTENK